MGCKGGDGERGEVRAGRRASGNRFKGGMNVTLSDYRGILLYVTYHSDLAISIKFMLCKTHSHSKPFTHSFTPPPYIRRRQHRFRQNV